MTTTPYVSVESAMPQQMSQYAFEFESNPMIDPNQHQQIIQSQNQNQNPTSSTYHTPRRNPVQHQQYQQQRQSPLSSSPPELDYSSPQYANENQPTQEQLQQAAYIDPHVDPSMIFNTSIFTPATPKSFGSIISSSPYPGSFDYTQNQTPNPRSYSQPHIQGQPQQLPHQQLPLQPIQNPNQKTLQQQRQQQPQQQQIPVQTLRTPAPTPKRTQSISSLSNASARKSICERRHNPSLGLSRSHSMRRLSTAPSISETSNGPLSAPISSSSSSVDMRRSYSLKRRVSLNIADGRAVIDVDDENDENDLEDLYAPQMERMNTEPTNNLASNTRRHTIYDKSIDYINDNARRMSLESLFPELTPPPSSAPSQPQSCSSPPPSTASSVAHASSSNDPTDLTNYENTENNEENILSAPVEFHFDSDEENEKDDARDALKKALLPTSDFDTMDPIMSSLSANNSSFSLPVIY